MLRYGSALGLVTLLGVSGCAADSVVDAEAAAEESLSSTPVNSRGLAHPMNLSIFPEAIGVFRGFQRPDENGSVVGDMEAAVFRRNPNVHCSREYVTDYCWTTSCEEVSPPAAEFQPGPINAGTVRLWGGVRPLGLEPNQDGTYTRKTYDGPIWTPGSRLLWAVEGNAPEAHPAYAMVEAPYPLTLTQRPPDVINRHTGFTVRWGVPDDVRAPVQHAAQVGIYFIPMAPSPDETFVPSLATCAVPFANGQVELGPEVVGNMLEGKAVVVLQAQNEVQIGTKQQYNFSLIGDADYVDVTVE